MKLPLFYSMMMAAILALVISKIVYFGYTANYAADTFSRSTLHGRFDHDVYKYRILGKYLLFKLDDWLSSSMPEKGAEPRILVQTKNGSERFFLAFYYLNTFFLVLTSILVALLLDLDKPFQFNQTDRVLLLFFIPVMIGLSEFVITFYDVCSYFFQLLILYIFLRFIDRNYWLTLAIIGVLIILSTLNRESSALSVSIISVLLLSRYGFTRRTLFSIAGIFGCFLLTYIGLRILVIDPTHMRIINIQAGHLFVDTNIIGMLFWFLFCSLPFLMANSDENRWLIGLFFLFSLPYILTCLKDGVMWEVRLFMPLLIGSLFLSKITVTAPALSFSELYKKTILLLSQPRQAR